MQTDLRPSKRCRDLATSPDYVAKTHDQSSRQTERRYKKEQINPSAFDVESEISNIDLRFKINQTIDKKQMPLPSGRQPKKSSASKACK